MLLMVIHAWCGFCLVRPFADFCCFLLFYVFYKFLGYFHTRAVYFCWWSSSSMREWKLTELCCRPVKQTAPAESKSLRRGSYNSLYVWFMDIYSEFIWIFKGLIRVLYNMTGTCGLFYLIFYSVLVSCIQSNMLIVHCVVSVDPFKFSSHRQSLL